MSPVFQGILIMLAGIFFMTIMDALMKVQVATLAVFQVMFFRYLFGLVPLYLIARRTGGIQQIKTRKPWMHAFRVLMVFMAFGSFTLALKYVSLANATAIAFVSPFFVAGLSVWLLGERIGIHRITAIVVGFVGVLIVVQPDGEAFNPQGLWVILAAIGLAVSLVTARQHAETESAVSLSVWPAIGCLILSGMTLPFVWQNIAWQDIGVFAAMGFAGGLGQFLIVTAMQRGSPVVIGMFEYSAIIWAVMFDVLLWGEIPPFTTTAGVAVIIASGIYMAWREKRAGPTSP